MTAREHITPRVRYAALTLGLSVSFGLALGGCGEAPAPAEAYLRTVRTETVTEGIGGSTRTFSGVARAGERSRLSFRVPGRVRDVPINVGDSVTTNQVIARLDPADFQLQLQEARSGIANARAQLRSAEASYTRTRALYENQNASGAQLDGARSAAESARAQVASAGQGIRLLQRQLEYATLKAPAAGTISAVHVRASENVGAGTVVAEMQIGEQLEVQVNVPESVITRINRGDAVSVRFDALEGRTIAGTVFEVGVAGEDGSASFPITVRLDSTEQEARAGMAADVEFTFARQSTDAQFRLPSVAVAEDREGRYVYVVERTGAETGVVHRRAVVTGQLSSEGIAITEGVSAGDVVVIRGVSRIQDGLEVQLAAEEAAAPAGAEEAGAATPSDGEPGEDAGDAEADDSESDSDSEAQ